MVVRTEESTLMSHPRKLHLPTVGGSSRMFPALRKIAVNMSITAAIYIKCDSVDDQGL